MGAPNTVLPVEDVLICAGIEPMLVPQGGAHVRSAEVRIPFLFTSRPTVTATARATTGQAAAGIVFGIFSIKVNDIGSQTQIVIQATNVSKEGVPVDGDFVCDYVVVGKTRGADA